MKKLIGVVILLALSASFFVFYRANSKRPNILVILVDTLRADHLSYNGYERKTSPNIDALAKESIIFRNAVAPSAWTPPSVASLFTGIYPSVHGLMPPKSESKAKERTSRLDDSFETLAEVLQNSGYATSGISANPWISEKFGFAQGFQSFVSPGRLQAERVNRLAIKELENLSKGEQPFLLYLHYMDPHFTYSPPAGYKKTFTGPLQAREYPPKQTRYMALYDGEIRYVDDRLGELFSWLKGRDLYEDLVILFVSDHGEQFLERGFQGHADRLHVEETHVPFLLKANGLAREDQTVVSLIDALPTLLEIAGAVGSKPIHGISLLKDLEKRKLTGVLSEVDRHYNLKALVTPDRKKFIVEYPAERSYFLTETTGEKETSVYDMVSDPRELAPMPDEALKRRLQDEFSQSYLGATKIKNMYGEGAVPMDEKTLQELKSLGYF